MQQVRWFSRPFDFQPDNGLFPSILERLSGTPARLEEKVRDVEATILQAKPSDQWSVKEATGHLADLEPLWLLRVHDILAEKTVLTAADLDNRKTHEANHNARHSSDLLTHFRGGRAKLMRQLAAATDADLEKFSRHPRLQTPMRLIDLAYFVAEHDDHHLARMTRLLL